MVRIDARTRRISKIVKKMASQSKRRATRPGGGEGQAGLAADLGAAAGVVRGRFRRRSDSPTVSMVRCAAMNQQRFPSGEYIPTTAAMTAHQNRSFTDILCLLHTTIG